MFANGASALYMNQSKALDNPLTDYPEPMSTMRFAIQTLLPELVAQVRARMDPENCAEARHGCMVQYLQQLLEMKFSEAKESFLSRSHSRTHPSAHCASHFYPTLPATCIYTQAYTLTQLSTHNLIFTTH